MGKIRVTVYLREESYRVVKAFVEGNKHSFSGWLSAILDEMAGEIQGQPSMLAKPVGEMTLNEFGKLMEYWLKRAGGKSRED